MQSVILLILSLTFVFLPCEFGYKLSEAFEEIDYEIDQMHWYKFPAKMWKMLPLFLVGAQEPVYLHVFGSKSCAREDFKAVCTNCFRSTSKVVACHLVHIFQVVDLAFSYFMVLQQFEN